MFSDYMGMKLKSKPGKDVGKSPFLQKEHL